MTNDQNDKALIREQQGKHEGHDNADNNLQRQTHLDIIHKRIASCFHHQRIGRSRKGEAKHILAPKVTAKRKA